MPALVRRCAVALVLGLALPVAAQPAATPTAAPRTNAEPDRKFTFDGQAMGTVVSVFVWTETEAKAARAAEIVFGEMKRIDALMTTWDPNSEVSKINASAGGKPVVVSAETFAVIERAVDVSRRTRGVFDITVGAFKGLWKFDEDMDGSLPKPADVKARLAKVGWTQITLDKKRRSVRLRKPGMSITLGGIAKGYAVDRCAKLLHDEGYVSFLIQAGGDLYVSGKKGADPWVVGIRDPRGAHDAMFAVAPIEDHSFSTSGDYERGFVKDGKRYHHILDPRTGQPALASRSVTVRARDAFTADAWSKVLFILGWKATQELIKREKLSDFEVVLVDDKNQVHITKGIEPVLKLLKQPTAGP
ncbi:MAG: FAD:protein FMN transferase [Kofleriaceae bacterium]